MLLACVFYFLINFFTDNYNQIKNVNITFHIGYIFLSIGCFSLFLINLSLIWYLITKIFGCNLGLQQTIVYWFYSMLGKYIPGKLFLILGRVYLYEKKGINKKKIIFSLVLEIICGLIASLIVAQISIPYLIQSEDISININYYYALIILTLVFVHPKVIIYLINLYNKISNQPRIDIDVKYSKIFLIVILYLLNYFLLGSGFYFLVNSLFEINPNHFLFLTSIYVLAGTIGILALFSPSGIGVRESVLVILLPTIMPTSYAALIMIISRLWETIIEIGMTLSLIVYAKIKNIKLYFWNIV